MHKPMQVAVDERIHQFLARKSEKRLSDKIAEFIIPEAKSSRKSRSEIAYERIGWSKNTAAGAH